MKKKTKTAKKATRRRGERIHYTYNTPMSIVEKEVGFNSGMPPNTKFGDYLKQNGQAVMASMLPTK